MSTVPPQPLPFILGAGDIIPTMTQHIDAHNTLVNNIVANINASIACFDNVIRPLVELENAQAGEQAVIAALKYISPALECQHMAEKAEAMWQEYYAKQRRELYSLVKAVQDRGESLDRESQKLLDRTLLEFEEYGYAVLDDDGIYRRLERVNKLKQHCTEFHRSLREDNSGEFFTPEELDGVPKKDRQPAGPDGKEFFSYSSKYFIVLRYAHSQETRKRIFLGYNQRFAGKVALFREAVLLRDENARELGHANHAITKLPYRSAESIEWVEDLMNNLAETLIPYGRAEFERAVKMKQQHLQQDSAAQEQEHHDTIKLQPWDFLYYSTMLDNNVQVDRATIAEYFPLRHTFSALLSLFADCLQLRFDPIPREVLKKVIWHEDVEAWIVWDGREGSNGEFIGYLFVDLLSRPNKYKGNQSVNLQPGYLKVNGTRVYPANILMCNFHSSSPATGCLLSHPSVITLFHELGHSIHDLLARTTYARFHGYQVTPELAEGIAIMLEQWCWLPDELKAISRHYTRVDPVYMELWLQENPGCEIPPERIPDKILEHRLSRRGHAKIFTILGMLVHVFFDLAVHSPASRESLLQLDQEALFRDVFERLKFRRLPYPSYGHADIGLLLAGYDAGYYSYVCAEIFAADLFQTAFSEKPRSREAWESLRRGILEPGGSGNDLEMLQDFLGGRSPNTSALLSMLGISARPSRRG